MAQTTGDQARKAASHALARLVQSTVERAGSPSMALAEEAVDALALYSQEAGADIKARQLGGRPGGRPNAATDQRPSQHGGIDPGAGYPTV